jgi:hypothetical protein
LLFPTEMSMLHRILHFSHLGPDPIEQLLQRHP